LLPLKAILENGTNCFSGNLIVTFQWYLDFPVALLPMAFIKDYG
jgi:hypothetical protein